MTKKILPDQFGLNELVANKGKVPPEVTVNDGLVIARGYIARVEAGTSRSPAVDKLLAKKAALVVRDTLLESEKKAAE